MDPSHATNALTRDFKYQPRSLFLQFHQREQRWACLVAHRRAGKTVACVAELIIRAIYTQKQNARYAYIAPYYSQAKQAAWTYLKDLAQPFINSLKDVRESELSVQLINGATIRLYGADNPDALRGTYFDGVILDEFGDCRPSLWGAVILPTLADRKGWAVFIGTPKGKNHFYDIDQRAQQQLDWFQLTLKASTTQILPAQELLEMRAQMTDAEYNQELECDFSAAVLGTYYANIIAELERNNQIRNNHPTHDPNQPTHVSADLGYKDSTALWFWQHAPDGLAIIDYEEHHTQPLEFYFDLLRSKPYTYDTIWLPHDAMAKTLQTGRSTIEQFLDPPPPHQRFPVDKVPNLKVQQGIDAARLVLPYCHFNLDACYAGVEALRAYKRKYDEVKKVMSNTPLHNWASDGADSFRYLALVAKVKLPSLRHRRASHTTPDNAYKHPGYTLQQLYDDRDNRQIFQFERDRI